MKIGLLIFFILISSCQSKKLVEKSATKTIKTRTKTDEQKVNLTIAFVGDIILHERIRHREESTGEGYQLIWSEIQNGLSSADLTYANLEGPVAPDYGGLTGFPKFNYPEKIISDLKNTGFDVVSTANNHALDRKAVGIRKTIENLNKYNLAHSGTLSTALSEDLNQETWWALTPIENKKFVAWLACTEMTNGIHDKENQVLYCYKDKEKIKKLIKKMVDQKDIVAVIVNPHWGEENTFDLQPNRRHWARQLLNQGALAVIGSHPHVVQKIETYQTNDQRTGVIAYSLGNFVSNQSDPKNKASMIFYLKLQSQKNSTKYMITDFKYLPIWMHRQKSNDGTSVFRLEAAFEDKKFPKKASEIWNQQLGNEKRLHSEKELNQFLKK